MLICVTSRRSTRFYFIFLAVFWVSLSAIVKYTLSCLVSLYGYHKELIWKFKNRCQNRDRFFLQMYADRILIGIRDSQAKLEESRRALDFYG